MEKKKKSFGLDRNVGTANCSLVILLYILLYFLGLTCVQKVHIGCIAQILGRAGDSCAILH